MSTGRPDSTRRRIGRRKIAASLGVALALAALLFWLLGSTLPAGAFALSATVLGAGLLLLELIRRYGRRQRNAKRGAAYAITVGDRLQLDLHLLANHAPRGIPEGRRPRIVRTPMQGGRGSLFLNHVEIQRPLAPTIQLVEKGAFSKTNEVVFWQEASKHFVLRSERYECLAPVDLLDARRVSVLYFPYVPALDREQQQARAEFRSNILPIVTTLADFNGRNLLTTQEPPSIGPAPFAPTRPSHDGLVQALDLAPDQANQLVTSWDAVHEHWPTIVREIQERLPRCLCHNDVSPGNTAHSDGVTTLTDFGLASVGQVGSDLHTILRWLGRRAYQASIVDEVIETYTNEIRRYDGSISSDDVRLAAWATYYLRYTNLKIKSARYAHIFSLAVDRMSELTAHRPASPS